MLLCTCCAQGLLTPSGNLAATTSSAFLPLAPVTVLLSFAFLSDTLVDVSVGNLAFSFTDFAIALLFLITAAFACSVVSVAAS
jgi:hypothetical protein